MISFPVPVNEHQRLQALERTRLMDTDPELEFDEVVKLASQICKVPISLISLLDANRQWFKAKVGLPISETPRNFAFCGHAIMGQGTFIVQDALTDERFLNNPLVTGDPKIRYYAGVPLRSSDGFNLGTLCVIDKIERQLDDDQIFALETLARQVEKIIDLRRKNEEILSVNQLLKKINSITAHDVRGPLGAIKSLISFNKQGLIDDRQLIEMLPTAEIQLEATIDLLNNLVEWGKSQTSNNDKPNLNKCVLANTVQAVITQILLQAEVKNNQLANLVKTDLEIISDEDALQFILRNLLNNANKFTSNGKIVVSAVANDRLVEISVSDTGIGLSNPVERTPAGQFLMKTRLGTSSEKGSGLGLQLVTEHLKKMQGQLLFTSIPGKGTAAILQLPV